MKSHLSAKKKETSHCKKYVNSIYYYINTIDNHSLYSL